MARHQIALFSGIIFCYGWHAIIKRGESSLASFLACIEESISEREGKQFEEGLNSKVKLDMYKRFGKGVEFKRYLHGVGDAGTRLLFKFRSGTHGLNEELGRHRGREGKSECVLCGAECESVIHCGSVQPIVILEEPIANLRSPSSSFSS